MPFYITFHDFCHGQLDKTLKSRSDLDVYNKGALELKNLVVRPGGAAKSRFGTEFLFESHPTAAPGAIDNLIEPNPLFPLNERGYQMFSFSPSDKVKLLIILGAADGTGATVSHRFQYYVEENKQTAIPIEGTINTVDFSTGFTAAQGIDCLQVTRVKYRVAQNQTTLVLVTATQPPIIFEWTGAGIDVSQLKYRRYPQHDFTRNGYVGNSPTFVRYTITGGVVSGQAIQPTVASVPTATLPTLSILNPGALIPSFPGFWFDGSTADSHYVGGVVQMAGPVDDPTAPIGYAIIEAIDSNTVARIRIYTRIDSSWDFATAVAGVTGDQMVLTEPAFSSPSSAAPPPPTFPGRGHPRTVSFYESRLCFAGSEGLPQSIFMSQIGAFENFDTGTGEPADGIAYTIASGAEDEIINMVSGRSLQVFTTTNEFSAPVWSEQGLTPTTVTIRRQTSIGSLNCIPAILDNMTIYGKRGGKAIMAFESLNSGGNTYNSQDASVYSSEIINNPIHMTSYVESVAYDANLLFVINKPDIAKPGQLVIYESLREQNVAAWTTNETDGEFTNAESVGDDVFFMVKREGTTGTPPVLETRWSLERMNWLVCLDSAISFTAPNPGLQLPITLPVGMRGKTVEIVGWTGDDPATPKGVWLGEINVPDTGVVSPDIPEWSPGGGTFQYWIGLRFEQRLQTMPVDVKTQMGSMLFLKKKIYKCYIEYIDSYPFFVNGIEADIRSLGFANGQYPPGYNPGILLNAEEEPYSGIWMRPTMQLLNLPPASGKAFRGFVREATVLITNNRPLPMVIQGITAATS